MSQQNPTALIMAGGTGGHVFPGLAVADELKNRGWIIEWLGTAERMEAELVPRHGYTIHFIDVQGVRGNGLLRKLAAPIKILKAIFQAVRILRQQEVDLVIGMGGFASGPGAIAARMLGLPVVLHEQNAIAGMTNRYVAKFASRVMQAFSGALPQGQTVGNPVRQELLGLPAPQPLLERPLKLLVVGGSLGAKVLNQTVPLAVAELTKSMDVEVWHQAGKNSGKEVLKAYQELNLTPYHADDFIHEMAEAYSWADLVLCRAGALTVSELAAIGRASILVPLPHAVDDHQTANAKVLVNAKAGVLLPQAEFTPESLANEIKRLTKDPEQIVKMAQNAEHVAITDAAQQVASVCETLIQQRGMAS